MVVGILAVAAPMAAVPGTAPAERASIATVAPGDAAATHTFLQAEYELAKATVARSRAFQARATRAAEALGRKCKGVLRGAPDESVLEEEGPAASWPKLSGRAQGERARSEREKQVIDSEIEETILVPAERVLRGPLEAFSAAVGRLTWSDSTISALARQQADSLTTFLTGPRVSACAEMRSWAASGFHLLPPGSRSLEEARNAHMRQRVPGGLAALLRPYETPADRAIIRRTAELRERLDEPYLSGGGLSGAEYHLDVALGEKVSRFASQRVAPVIAKGHALAGTTFLVRQTVRGSVSHSCRHEVQVEWRESHSGSSSGVCLDQRVHARPSGSCSGNVQTVELATPAYVHRARVRFSDGRTTTVSVVRIPSKDGGPAGLFIDAFRGYNPHPTSVQELGRSGKVLRTVRLNGVTCGKEPPGGGPGPPEPIVLAKVTAPDGEPLFIGAILHRFQGQTEFFLDPGPSIRKSEAGEGGVKPKEFEWQLSTECAPHPYSLLDGILALPGASVLVRTPAGLVPLSKLELTASTHAGGPLFYGIYTSPPTEIVVEASDGSIIYTESLAAKAAEETEFCEGYAER